MLDFAGDGVASLKLQRYNGMCHGVGAMGLVGWLGGLERGLARSRCDGGPHDGGP